MGHIHANKDDLIPLVDRLNQYPIGAPPTEDLYEILSILYSKDEAYLASKFPLTETTVAEMAKRSGWEPSKIESVLDGMCNKGLAIDFIVDGKSYYILSPTVVGFFEFTFMKTRGDIPQKKIAGLMNRYFKESFKSELFGSKTKISRALINSKNLPTPVTTEILTHEEAIHVVKNSGGGSLGTCYCRHVASHNDTPCKMAPMEETCMSLGNAADFMVRRGFARRATVDELLEVLEKVRKLGLAHIADNVRDRPTFICNCCKCCCGFLKSANRYGIKRPVATTSYVIQINKDVCKACGKCVKTCTVNAVEIIRNRLTNAGTQEGDAGGGPPMTHSPPGRRASISGGVRRQDPLGGICETIYARVKEDECIGCGVCLPACENGAIEFMRRKKKVKIPKNTKMKFVKIAKEKGRLGPIVKDQLRKIFLTHIPKNPYT